MFIENKYKKWYDGLILKRIKTPSAESYTEKHHIIPRSMGGGNEKENIVVLSAREHYVAHLLLTKICESKNHTIRMMWAFHRLAFSTHISSHHYERSRKIWSKFLKENHHSKRIPGWNDRMRQKVLKDWENNVERKQNLSDKMKKRWEKNRKEMIKHSLNNLPDPMIGKDNPNVKSIDYKGITYYGWRELKEATGCSKFLYEKLYMNGIDPSFRLGKDGPMNVEELKHLFIEYCKKCDIIVPTDKKGYTDVLTRMRNVGMLTDKQAVRLVQTSFGKESR